MAGWGPTWGEQGYIRLQKGLNETSGAICGITLSASYPVKKKSAPLPVPPLTPNGTRPGPPKPGPTCPGCKPGAHDVCRMLGMHCFCGPPYYKSTVCRHDKKCCKKPNETLVVEESSMAEEEEEDDSGSCLA